MSFGSTWSGEGFLFTALLSMHPLCGCSVSEQEAEEVMFCAKADLQCFPFSAVERWMVVQGHPPRRCWIPMKGVPLHIWRERILQVGGLLGMNPRGGLANHPAR